MLHRSYMSLGKEVLLDGKHVADATDIATAELIANALNHAPANIDPEGVRDESAQAWDDFAIDLDNLDPRVPASLHETLIRTTHHVTRQGDEYACSCGTRWDVSEGDEHP